LTANVRAAAASEPPEGSLNSWHQISSPFTAGPTKRALSASLPAVIKVGMHMPSPMENGPDSPGAALASSWLKIMFCQVLPPWPPHSVGQVMAA
jgi:hypothetical protein